MAATVRAGTVGLAIRLNVTEGGVALDLASATNLKVDLTRPDRTVVSYTGTLGTDGSDGKFQYTTVAGDLTQTGQYQAMGSFTLAGWSGATTAALFQVDPAF